MEPLPIVDSTPAPSKIRVSIDEHMHVTSSHPIPPLIQIIDALCPHSTAQYVRTVGWGRSNVHTLRDCMTALRDRISNEQWVKAIVKATMLAQTWDSPFELTANASLIDSAYLTIGDRLYQLNPVNVISTNALRASRRLIINRAKADAKLILDSADRASSIMVSRAEAIAAALKETYSYMPPKWSEGIPIRYVGSRWELSFIIAYKPRTILYVPPSPDENTRLRLRVPTLVKAQPLRTRFWIPIAEDGSYEARTTRSETHTLPHIDTSSSCLSIQSAPKLITTNFEFISFNNEYCRSMNTDINLNSLFAAYYQWPAEVKRMIPVALAHALQARYNTSEDRSEALKAAMLSHKGCTQEPFDPQQEENITWHIT